MKRHNSIIKMTITTENYEFYALDYLEGNLDATTQEAMDNFLQKHPELQAEMEDMLAIILEPEDDIIFEKKDSLRKKVVLNSGKSRVLPIWFRYAAAAAVIFALIYGTVQMSKQYNYSAPMEVVQEDELAPKVKHKELPMPNTPKKMQKQKEAEKVEVITETKIEENQYFNSKNPNTNNTLTPDNQNLAEADKFIETAPKEDKKITAKKESPIFIAEKVIENSNLPQIEERQFSTTAIVAIDADAQIMVKKIAQREAVVEMSLLYESQILVETINAEPKKKEKKWKTPFGTIKWGEVAEALTPESYFASK